MYYLGEDWTKEMDPNRFANARLALAAVIAALSDLLPEAEKRVSMVKKAREERFLALRKDEEQSAKDAETNARVESFEALWQAEYDRDTLKNTCDGLKEISNALSTKIGALQSAARNQS